MVDWYTTAKFVHIVLVVLVAVLVYAWVVSRQLRLPEDGNAADDGYRRLALAGVVPGGVGGVVFTAIVYVMIATPW